MRHFNVDHANLQDIVHGIIKWRIGRNTNAIVLQKKKKKKEGKKKSRNPES